MKLIGLSGYARSGKDTVAKILQDQHGFERVGYADALREVLLRLDPVIDNGIPLGAIVSRSGWEWAKDSEPEVRRLLQQLGVAIRDVVDEDAWVNAALRKMHPGRGYVIPDVRFPNEFLAIKNEGGVMVRIERPGYGPVNGHVSEVAIDNEPFDYTFWNDGTTTKLERYCAALVAEMELVS